MSTEGTAPLLFISHSSQDKELVKRLVSVLQAALDLDEEGDVLFTASVAEGLEGGDDFAERLRKALDACRKVILVVTEKSLASHWVMVEAGAAYVRRKLIPVLARSGYENLMRDPLRRLHCLALDNAAEIDKLIDQLRETLGRGPVKPSRYQEKIDDLVGCALQQYRRRTPLTAAWARLRAAPLGYRLSGAALAAVLVMAALRGLLAPVSFTGFLYEENGAVVPSARVRLDTTPDVETDREGTWRFETGWVPRSRRFRVRRPGGGTVVEGRWFGPNWRQWFGLEAPAVSLRLREDRVEIAGRAAPSGVGVALAASPPAAPVQPAPAAGFEFGFWLQELRVGQVPGWIQKSRRAFLKVSVGSKELDDDQIRTAPLILGDALNLFPVQLNPRSWLVIDANVRIPAKGRYCRLPAEALASVGVDAKGNDALTLARPVRVRLVGDRGDTLSEFDLTGALNGPIAPGKEVSGSAPGYALTLRPELKVAGSPAYKPVWAPAGLQAAPGSTASLFLRLPRNLTMPFDTRISLGYQAILPNVPLPSSDSSLAPKLPRAVLMRRGQSEAVVSVAFPQQAVNITLFSILPRALGGSMDTALITVR